MKNTDLTNTYRELDRELAILHDQLESHRSFENILFLPTPEKIRSVREKWNDLKTQVENLDAPDNVYRLVKHHLNDFLDSLKFTIEEKEHNPEAPLLDFVYYLQEIARCDRRSNEVRLDLLTRKLQAFHENQDLILNLIHTQYGENEASLSSAFARARLDMQRDQKLLNEYFPDFTEEQIASLSQSFRIFIDQLQEMADLLGSDCQSDSEELLKDDLSKTIKMDPEAYRSLLKNRLGVSLDELLAWHKEEIEKTRAEVFEIASKLELPEGTPKTMKEVSDVLFRYAGPCDSAEELYTRARNYLKRTRAVAHEYVRLPEDETCLCVPLPPCYKDSYPWGGYEGGDFRVKPLRGQMFLNQYNYQNITDGWIKMNTMHETYPGHHVQFIRAAIDPTLETVKIGAKSVPLEEGTCIRTERAFTFIFAEDPFFPLFVAFRRHHASVRILVDLQLYYFGATLEDAVKIYEEELGFDRVTARAQVQAHQNAPGYFTCYYYGMKKICDWEKEYGYTKWDYTELLFSAGRISMESLEMLVKMTKEEQGRFFTEFRSLLMDE